LTTYVFPGVTAPDPDTLIALTVAVPPDPVGGTSIRQRNTAPDDTGGPDGDDEEESSGFFGPRPDEYTVSISQVDGQLTAYSSEIFLRGMNTLSIGPNSRSLTPEHTSE
jgi:hypothetical protein